MAPVNPYLADSIMRRNGYDASQAGRRRFAGLAVFKLLK